MNQRLLALARLEALLVRVLTRAVGNESVARDILDAAISESTWELSAEEPKRVAVFAYAHLVPRVAEHVGARAALLMLDELDASLRVDSAPSVEAAEMVETVSGVRASRYRVVVLESRAFERAQIARHLVAGECDVVACGSADEALRDVVAADAVVFDPSEVDLGSVTILLDSLDPSPLIVLRSTPSKVEALVPFASTGRSPVIVVPPSASPRDLVWALRGAVAARQSA